MTTKTEILPGTILAIARRDRRTEMPALTYNLYRVDRLTNTQAVATGETGAEIRVRLADFHVVGTPYEKVAIATEAIQAEHAAELKERDRYRAADMATNDLVGRQLHQLKLSTAQLEALAKAWADIKAMA